MAQQHMPLDAVIKKVQSMTRDSNALKIVRDEKYSIHNVTWEDCARNKGSVWGPCISDMTLQVGDNRMPVIRESNFTDCTWDVEMTKIPIVVGNEKKINQENNNNNENDSKTDNFSQSGKPEKLETISLKQYLQNFDEYMTCPPGSNDKSKNNNNNKNKGNNNKPVSFPMNAVSTFDDSYNNNNKNDNNNNKYEFLNLLRKDESKDSHVIVSSQACFLPIEKNKETLFNVALFNYQSKKQDPAVLVIIATSKGTSAQIIEGSEQKLLFNNYGKKADFIAQRLTDNRIERGIKDLNAPMTVEEKQDNCIVIIQVPLKQKVLKPRRIPSYGYNGYNNNINAINESGFFGGGGVGGGAFGYPQQQQAQQQMIMAPMYGGGGMGGMMNGSAQPQAYSNSMIATSKSAHSHSHSLHRGMPARREEANVESAIVKVAPKTRPVCTCGDELQKIQLQFCYDNFGKDVSQMCSIFCDGCSKRILDGETSAEQKATILWHCKKEKSIYKHKDGYDLCQECAQKQLTFDELNGMRTITRDERYPIRVTLQYYKSTDNGIITKEIMKAISKQLKTSQKQSDYVGSLVNEYNSGRPTEWVKYSAFKINHQVPVSKNYSLVRDVLYNLDLSQYFNVFLQNEVTDARLILLEESDLKILFKKVGALVVFRHWLRSYKETLNQEKNNQNGNRQGNQNDGFFGF